MLVYAKEYRLAHHKKYQESIDALAAIFGENETAIREGLEFFMDASFVAGYLNGNAHPR